MYLLLKTDSDNIANTNENNNKNKVSVNVGVGKLRVTIPGSQEVYSSSRGRRVCREQADRWHL